jgi:hypothetical protein
MNDNAILFIEDERKRKLHYRFSPSAFISNFNPLLVILDDIGGIDAIHFEYKMWNVLTPLDCYTDKDINIDYMGHKGDMLQELIDHIAKKYECEDHIYLIGSGWGAYGVILHGLMCKANAIYAPIPQIKEPHMQTFRSIFKEKLSDKRSPIMYLCPSGTEDDTVNYFFRLCTEHGIKADLNFCPEAIGYKEETLKEVLHFFERMISDI